MRKRRKFEEKEFALNKVCVDTSALIHGKITELIKSNKLKNSELIIPEVVIGELQSQAAKGKETGFIGLEEIKKIRELVSEHKITLKFIGERPSYEDILLAKSGRIDALIQDIAKESNAVLVTCDLLQGLVAQAQGIMVKYFESYEKKKRMKIEDFLTEDTMSLHLKEGAIPYAKRGKPGEIKLVSLRDKKMSAEEVDEMATEILDAARYEEDSFIELGEYGATVVQLKDKRIAIARPPFSDGLEITLVRPIVKLTLDDYKLSEKLKERLDKKAEGIIIAGPPGSGKCLPGFETVFTSKGEVKTIEEYFNSPTGDLLSVDEIGNLTFKHPKKFFKRKEKKLVKIVTRTGRELTATEEHPLLSIHNGVPFWVSAKEVTEGDKIAVLRKTDLNTSLQPIDWLSLLDEQKIWVVLKKDINLSLPYEEKFFGQKKEIISFIKKSSGCKLPEIIKNVKGNRRELIKKLRKLTLSGDIIRKGKRNFYSYYAPLTWSPKIGDNIPLWLFKKIVKQENFKKYVSHIFKRDYCHYSSKIQPVYIMTSELAELLGYYIAECIKKYGISTDTPNVKERFIELSRQIFDIEVEKRDDKKFVVWTDKYGTIDHFLSRCFKIPSILDNRRASKQVIPPQIFLSPNIEVATFLRALFSVESSIDAQKGCIDLIMASENVIRGVQNLLLRFGITSILSMRQIKGRTYWRLGIYGYRNRKLFCEYIGFSDENKQNLLYSSLGKKGFMNTDLIPAGPLLCYLNKNFKLRMDNYDLKKNEYSPERLQRYIAKLELPDDDRLTKLLSILKFINSEFIMWDRIESIEKIEKECTVYDFEIENTHNFIAGSCPIIVHNSTFSASLAEFYFKDGKIVKTLEQPRDLQVPPEITQYAPLEGSFLKTANILLLVRPDYTIFDDIRKPKDFEIFSDLRLAGIGMVGVVHATDPVDAVQRFIGKIELGVIPHVIDTIIFIKGGKVEKVYSLTLTVRVPSGMTEADLARPIVEVRDFETGGLEYEIYSYGEQTTVIPVRKEKKSALQSLATDRIRAEIRKFDPSAEIEFLSDNKIIAKVNNKAIPRLIGKEGKTIKSIEDRLGMSIEVQPMVESLGKEVKFDINETGAYIVLSFDGKIAGKNANVYINDEYLFSATVGRTGQIKISKNSDLGKSLLRTVTNKKDVKVFV